MNVSLQAVPIHEGEVSGRTVRWFASPVWRKSGTADMPWHAAGDLWQALGLEGETAQSFLRSLRSDWAEPVTVASGGALLTLAPHFMAEGLIAALIDGETGGARRDALIRARGAYRRNCTAAMKEMLRGMHPMGKLAFALEAMEAGPARAG